MTCDIIPILKNGKESELFKSLLDALKDRSRAVSAYKYIYSPVFAARYGDWVNDPSSVADKLDANKEPKLETVLEFLPSSYTGEDVNPDTLYQKGSPVSTLIDNLIDLKIEADGLEEIKKLLDTSELTINENDHIDGEIRYNPKKKEIVVSKNIRSGFELGSKLLKKLAHVYAYNAIKEGDTAQKQDLKNSLLQIHSVFKNSIQDKENSFYTSIVSFDEFVRDSLLDPSFQKYIFKSKPSVYKSLTNLYRDVFGRNFVKLMSASQFKNKVGFTDYRNKDIDFSKSKDAISQKEKLLNKAILSLESRISEFENRAIRAETKGEIAQFRIQKADLQDAIRQGEVNRGLLDFSKNSYDQIKNLHDNFQRAADSGSLTIGLLNTIRKYSKAFRVLNPILAEVESDERFKEDYPEALEILQESQKLLRSIEKNYADNIKILLVEKLLPYEKSAELQFRQDAEREFNIDQLPEIKNLSKNEIAKRKRNFINNAVLVNKAEIEANSRAILQSQFEHADQDISTIEFWAISAQNSSDQLLSIAKQLIDKAQDNVRNDYNEFKEEFESVLADFKEWKGDISNQKKLYEDILEKEGDNLTGRLVQQYRSGWSEAFEQMLEETKEIASSKTRSQIVKKWLKDNAVKNPEWVKSQQQMNKDYKSIKKEKGVEAANTFRQSWYIQNKNKKWLPSKKWENAQFNRFNPSHSDYLGKDHPLVKFYSFVTESQERFDATRPENRKLNGRLPGIYKSAKEKAFSEGSFGFEDVKRSWDNLTKIQSDDLDFVDEISVSEDIEGNINKFVPIHFSKDIPVDDRSFDVASLIASNAYTSLNHKHMNAALPEIESIKAVMGERDVVEKSGLGKTLISKQTGESHVMKGDKSKSYELLSRMMDDKIFGRRHVESKVLGMNPKVHNQIQQYTSIVMLSFNWVSSFVNVAMGTLLSIGEAVSGTYFNKSEFKKGIKKYWNLSDIKKNIDDIGANQKTSLTNLLSERFDALNNFQGRDFSYMDDKWWKKILSHNTLYSLTSLGEHFVQHASMYAFFERIKVVNADGDYIDSEGNVVDRNKAMSLSDAFTAEDGKLVENDLLKRVDINGKILDWNKDTEFEIIQKLRAVNERMHGAYGEQNKAEIQRHVVGRYAIMMRRWMIPGMRRRWSNISNYKNSQQVKRLNTQLGALDEGTYTTLVGFVYRVMQDLKSHNYNIMKAYSNGSQWQEMTDYEKANMLNASYEASLMLLALLGTTIAQSAAEDDDDEARMKWFLAYSTRRVLSELTFYWNPVEVFRIIKDPTPAVSTVEDVLSLFEQALTFGEDGWRINDRYERGRRKGQLKIRKDVENIIPWWRHWDSINNMEDKLTFFQQ